MCVVVTGREGQIDEGTRRVALRIRENDKVVAKLGTSSDPSLRGVFHMTGQGDTSWAGFVMSTFSSSTAVGGPAARVRPISSSEYPTRAMRPANSRLNNKLAQNYDVRFASTAGFAQTNCIAPRAR